MPRPVRGTMRMFFGRQAFLPSSIRPIFSVFSSHRRNIFVAIAARTQQPDENYIVHIKPLEIIPYLYQPLLNSDILRYI
jgi:hypothetical protein